jgi:sulfite reductase (NADPH) hemoprotein beta-component
MTKEGYTSNERIKEESDFLRGNISDLLHDGSITHFPSEEEFLLKFHLAILYH